MAAYSSLTENKQEQVCITFMALVKEVTGESFKMQRMFNRSKSLNVELGPPRKKLKTSRPKFEFSLDDLNRHLYTRDELKSTNDQSIKDSKKEDEMCFWCDAITPQDNFKCPYHGEKKHEKPAEPAKPEVPYALSSIPDEVRLCKSNIPGAGYGIQANTVIPAGAWIGPYEGNMVKAEDAPKEKNFYMWEIFKDGRLYGFIDGSDHNTASWMRFIRCARNKEEQNLFAFQYLGKIYYRTYRTIPMGEELLVWYDDKYTQYMEMPFAPTAEVAIATTDGNLLQLLRKVPAHETPEPIAGPVTPPATPTKRQNFTFTGPTSGLEKNKALQMRFSYQRIGALQSPGATREANGPEKPATFKPLTSTTAKTAMVSPVKPSPQHSKGFELEITQPKTVKPSVEMTNKVAFPPSPNSGSSADSLSSPSSKGCFKFDASAPVEVVGTERNDVVETSLWRCGQCKKSFAQRAMLQIHVCARIPNRPYQCGHCGDSFCQPSELRAHAVVHQGRKPFKCGYCSRAFSGATTLNNHIRTHTGEKPFTCEKCGKTFTQGSQLSRHHKIPGDCVPRS